MLRKKLRLSANDAQEGEEANDTEGSSVPSKSEAGNSNDNKVCVNPDPVQYSITFEPEFWEKIWKMEESLAEELLKIDYTTDKNIAAIYNPLDYAADVHKIYMKKFLKKAPTVLFLGMNPGLFGMCQTSASDSIVRFVLILISLPHFQVPFGNVPSVKNWMKIEGEVNKPSNEIAAKPIEGFNCTRAEQSGKRFWGVLEELCGTPENFFRHCFVYNICPLAFLNATGRNITPPEIKGGAKSQLNSVCLDHLKQAIDIFNPKVIVSIGNYVNDRVKELKKKNLISGVIDCKLLAHPSPRATNNQDWVEKAKKWFADNDVDKYFTN